MTHEANEIFIKKTAESDQIYRIVKLSMFAMKQTFHSIKFYRKNRICELKYLIYKKNATRTLSKNHWEFGVTYSEFAKSGSSC